VIATTLAIVAGCICGVLLLARLLDGDRLATPTFSAFYLCLLACLYPLFCVLTGPLDALPRHAAIAAACIVLALVGFRFGFAPVIAGFAAQGVLNIVMGLGPHPGHDLWPAFAAPFAITLAVGLTLLTREDRSLR
jgi:hypothetical protein